MYAFFILLFAAKFLAAENYVISSVVGDGSISEATSMSMSSASSKYSTSMESATESVVESEMSMGGIAAENLAETEMAMAVSNGAGATAMSNLNYAESTAMAGIDYLEGMASSGLNYAEDMAAAGLAIKEQIATAGLDYASNRAIAGVDYLGNMIGTDLDYTESMAIEKGIENMIPYPPGMSPFTPDLYNMPSAVIQEMEKLGYSSSLAEEMAIEYELLNWYPGMGPLPLTSAELQAEISRVNSMITNSMQSPEQLLLQEYYNNLINQQNILLNGGMPTPLSQTISGIGVPTDQYGIPVAPGLQRNNMSPFVPEIYNMPLATVQKLEQLGYSSLLAEEKAIEYRLQNWYPGIGSLPLTSLELQEEINRINSLLAGPLPSLEKLLLQEYYNNLLNQQDIIMNGGMLPYSNIPSTVVQEMKQLGYSLALAEEMAIEYELLNWYPGMGPLPLTAVELQSEIDRIRSMLAGPLPSQEKLLLQEYYNNLLNQENIIMNGGMLPCSNIPSTVIQQLEQLGYPLALAEEMAIEYELLNWYPGMGPLPLTAVELQSEIDRIRNMLAGPLPSLEKLLLQEYYNNLLNQENIIMNGGVSPYSTIPSSIIQQLEQLGYSLSLAEDMAIQYALSNWYPGTGPLSLTLTELQAEINRINSILSGQLQLPEQLLLQAYYNNLLNQQNMLLNKDMSPYSPLNQAILDTELAANTLPSPSIPSTLNQQNMLINEVMSTYSPSNQAILDSELAARTLSSSSLPGTLNQQNMLLNEEMSAYSPLNQAILDMELAPSTLPPSSMTSILNQENMLLNKEMSLSSPPQAILDAAETLSSPYMPGMPCSAELAELKALLEQDTQLPLSMKNEYLNLLSSLDEATLQMLQNMYNTTGSWWQSSLLNEMELMKAREQLREAMAAIIDYNNAEEMRERIMLANSLLGNSPIANALQFALQQQDLNRLSLMVDMSRLMLNNI